MKEEQHISHATSASVVKPFFNYAASALIVSLILLLITNLKFPAHYFEPKLLTITHIMALGWGTMIIMGSVYQLIPVLSEQKLFSEKLAVISFFFTACGIPLLSYGFYQFNMGLVMQIGALLINIGLLFFLINVFYTVYQNKFRDIHSGFILYAVFWLQTTTIIGLLLVFNFSYDLLSKDSVYFLSFHAHIGIIGWFFLLVTGVSTRLIPMFLISKYRNDKLLMALFVLINATVISFALIFLTESNKTFYLLPVSLVLISVVLLGYFFQKSYQLRLRKKVDGAVKLSAFAVAAILLPLISVITIITAKFSTASEAVLLQQYGFLIFFGWITLIILGMSFKTLPFIIWNEQFRKYSGERKIPQPGDLYSKKLFAAMVWFYVPGFLLFSFGILFKQSYLLVPSCFFLLIAGICYAVNIGLIQKWR